MLRVGLWPDAQEANRMIAVLCFEDPKFKYIDVGGSVLSDAGEPIAALFAEDGLHYQ